MKITYLNDYHYFNETIMPVNPIMVQVGVLDTVTAKRFKELYPESIMIGYEADPSNYNTMKKDAKKVGMTLVHKAVFSDDSPVQLNIFDTAVSSSLYTRADLGLREVVSIKSITLRKVLSSQKIPRIDLLVLNCEGSELDILKYLLENPDIFVRQCCVSFHCPRIYPMDCRDAIITQMQDSHFVVKELHKEGIPDILFIRKDV